MDVDVVFRWATYISDTEIPLPTSRNTPSSIGVGYAHTKTNLNQVAKAVKSVEELDGASVMLGDAYSSVIIKGLRVPISLVDQVSLDPQHEPCTVSDHGPTLEWLLGCQEGLNNPDPAKVLYFHGMAIRFSPHDYKDGCVTASVVSTEDVEDLVESLEGLCVPGLGSPFDEFLGRYGYTDLETNKRISYMLIVFQAAEKLGFKDPAAVAANLGDKCLGADLILRGVFADVGNV